MKAFPFYAWLLLAASHSVLATNEVESSNAVKSSKALTTSGLVSSIPSVITNPVPTSVFVVPTVPAHGRDPFFPESTRLGPPTESTNKQDSAATNLRLVLQGISGPTGRKLAIINGQTIGENEEANLIFGANRIPVRCVEIHSEHVIVEVLGSRRELRLRSSQ